MIATIHYRVKEKIQKMNEDLQKTESIAKDNQKK